LAAIHQRESLEEDLPSIFAALEDALQMALKAGASGPSSGLVEQQRLFQKLKP
jgi:hypothetical protein